MGSFIKDSRGKEFEVNGAYQRIASLVPSISELLFELNSEHLLKAVTNSCIHPSYLKHEKAIVGTLFEVNQYAMDTLNPDLIIASVDENNPEDIEELDKKYNVFVIDVRDIEQAKQNIENIGRLVGRKAEAYKINMKIDAQLRELRKLTENLLYRRVAYFIHNKPMVAVGKDTFINSMLREIKAINVLADMKERYPQVQSANLHLGNPDLLLLANNDNYTFEDADAIEIGSHTHDASIFFVEGEMFSWYGSRMVKAIDYLKLLAVKFEEMT